MESKSSLRKVEGILLLKGEIEPQEKRIGLDGKVFLNQDSGFIMFSLRNKEIGERET